MEYLIIFILFSIVLSWFINSYFPVLVLYSLLLAYIMQDTEPLLTGLVLISPIILFFYFNFFKKESKPATLISSNLFKHSKKDNLLNIKNIKTEKILSNNKTQETKEKKEITDDNLVKSIEKTEIIKRISEKIEKDKEISFSELSQIWRYDTGNISDISSEKSNQLSETDAPKNNTQEQEENQEYTNQDQQRQIQDNHEKTETIKNKQSHNNKYSNRFVADIYNNFVKNNFYSENFKKLAEKILAYLDRVGDEPSVTDLEDEDKANYSNYFDILKKITLAEHTYNVVKKVFELNKREYKDTWKISWDPLCVCAIAHDIGKAKFFRQETYIYGSHKEISQDILKKCIEEDNIQIQKDKISNLCAIIGFHHGIVPDAYKNNRTLELLKKGDQEARKEEITSKLDNVLTWKDIDIKNFGLKMYENMQEKAFTAEADKKPYFIIDKKTGLLFIHRDYIFLNTLRQYIKENNIFWQELNSSDDQIKINAIKTFMQTKMEPEQWLPSKKIANTSIKDFFYFITIEKNGKALGVRPFIVFLFTTFCKTIDIQAEKLFIIYKESPLSMFNILYKS